MSAKKSELNMNQLESVLSEYFIKKAPALPKNIKELIVKFAPWLSLLGVIISIPAILALFGLGAFISSVPYGAMAMAQAGYSYYISMIFVVITVILEALAIPGLMARSKKGWNLIFYSVLVSALSSLVNFQIVSLVLGLLIGLYVTFQVKEYYK